MITNLTGLFITMVVKSSDSVTVYDPNVNSPDMFHECFSHWLNFSYDSPLAGRDFNDILDTVLDRNTLPNEEW